VGRRGGVLNAVPWAGAESVFVGLVSIVSLLLIVRLVGPTAFGQATLAIALVSIVEAFFSCGMLDAVVRHRSADSRVFDTAVWTRAILGALAFLTCLSLASVVARVYSSDVATLFSIYSFSMLLNGINESRAAILIRKYRARMHAVVTITARSTMLLVTIVLALSNWGAMSIVIGAIAGIGTTSLLLWSFAPRLPSLRLDPREAVSMIRFGAAVAIDEVLGIVATRTFLALFGLYQGTQSLGYLSLSLKLVEESGAIISRAAWKIAYPMLAETRRLTGDVGDACGTATRYLTYFTIPIFAGIGVSAPVAIPVVFGEAWIPAVPSTMILAATFAVQASFILIPTYLKAMERQKLLVLLSALDAGLSITIVIATTSMDSDLVVLLWALRAIIVLPVELTLVYRATGLSPMMLITRAGDAALAAFVMLLILVPLVRRSADQPSIADFLALVGTGIAVYGFTLYVVAQPFRALMRKIISRAAQPAK
jgi:O-antigen/teichoic acid export membrane protein